jgi:hypothetical protein
MTGGRANKQRADVITIKTNTNHRVTTAGNSVPNTSPPLKSGQDTLKTSISNHRHKLTAVVEAAKQTTDLCIPLVPRVLHPSDDFVQPSILLTDFPRRP